MPSNLAGVEGFEPPNGGIKTRHNTQHNQQVTDSTDRNIPLQSLRFPIAATKAATSQNVVRGCRLPGTASKAGIRDLIALGVDTDTTRSKEHDESGIRLTLSVRIPARTRLPPTPRSATRNASCNWSQSVATRCEPSHAYRFRCSPVSAQPGRTRTNARSIPRSPFPPLGPFLCQILPKALRFRHEHNEYLPA
jgi:hypothetical protein